MAGEEIAKYALNSTIGTENFKPLDKIIDGQRQLAPSDNIYTVVFSGEMTVNNDKIVTVKSFKTNKEGSIRLFVGGYSKASTHNLEVWVVDENDVILHTVFLGQGVVPATAYLDMPVVAGKTYTIKIYFHPYNASAHLTSVKIGATIIDTSFIEVGD